MSCHFLVVEYFELLYIVDANNEILVYDYSGNKLAGVELNDINNEFKRSGLVDISEINENMVKIVSTLKYLKY